MHPKLWWENSGKMLISRNNTHLLYAARYKLVHWRKLLYLASPSPTAGGRLWWLQQQARWPDQALVIWYVGVNYTTWRPSVLWYCRLGVRNVNCVRKLGDEVLAWLSVCSEVQMICMWSSWCHYHPIISFFIEIQIVLTFLVLAYPGCCGK